jgi:hypothetical protein
LANGRLRYSSRCWTFVLLVGCSREKPHVLDAGSASCAVDSDAGISPNGPPYCYPESTKPSGPCPKGSPACSFCGYPPCSIQSLMVGPHTYYQCSCANGSWDCQVSRQFGSACPAVLSCFGPDGGLGTVCLSGAGISCARNQDAPFCVFAGGQVPQPCGDRFVRGGLQVPRSCDAELYVSLNSRRDLIAGRIS